MGKAKKEYKSKMVEGREVFVPEPGIYRGVPNEAYHADRTAVSSTWLKTIQKSPYHLRCLLDTPPEEDTPLPLVMGSAVDTLVFEPEEFKNFIVMRDDLNLRKTADREEFAEAKAKALSQGGYAMRAEWYEEAKDTAEAIRANPLMAEFLEAGVAQEVMVWIDPATGLLCKVKLDWYCERHKAIIDLKTAENAAPDAFSKAIANFGYHIQDAFYTDGARACGREVSEFIFATMEKPNTKIGTKPSPELMAFYRLELDDVEEGRRTYQSGLSTINMCMIDNQWNGYTNEVLQLTRPGWAKKSDVENIEL